jgi:hypothetical protein
VYFVTHVEVNTHLVVVIVIRWVWATFIQINDKNKFNLEFSEEEYFRAQRPEIILTGDSTAGTNILENKAHCIWINHRNKLSQEFLRV